MPSDAGKLFFCLGSGSGAASFSSSSSVPAPNSSSAVGSFVSRSVFGARKPVRYQRDGAIVRTSALAASSTPASNGPTRSA